MQEEEKKSPPSSTPSTILDDQQAKRINLLSCGLMSGLICSFVFNPWDRALFLSVTYSRPFLSYANFVKPFDGVLQSIFQRALSSGMYFPLEEIFEKEFAGSFGKNNSSSAWLVLFAGFCAGGCNALLLNPLSAIKYHMWNASSDGKASIGMLKTAREMFKLGGIRPFFIGTTATISRDVLFGGTFAGFRHQFLPYLVAKETVKSGRRENSTASSTRLFCLDFVSACVATGISSPFNYVRNIHYAVPSGVKAESHYVILRSLWINTWKQPTLRQQWDYMSTRLRIGWGTLRVGCGMGLASQLYIMCKGDR